MMQKRGIALLLSCVMLLGMLAGCGGSAGSGEDKPASGGEGIFTPGTYEGEAQGFGGPVTVKLTVDEAKITDVAVTGEQETPDVGGKAIPQLQEQLLSAQSAEIDGVSGATVTSTAVRDAAAKAIGLAMGKTAAAAAALTPGTYTATAEGFQKEHVTVSVTVDESAITDVQIVECTDNPSTVTDAPCREIPAAIVDHQSYNVDGITGATITSNAIKSAVRDCLDQAGGSDAFSAAVEKTAVTAGEDAEVDILVVGGGAAGMIASLEAYQGEEGEKNSGLSVMLIEKAGFLGGSASVSGGGFYQYLDETGAYDEAWRRSVVEQEKEHIAPVMQHPFNEDLLYGETGIMDRTTRMLDNGGYKYTFTWYYMTPEPPDGVKEKKWAGSYLTKWFLSLVDDTDIEVRLNTAATGLLMGDHGEVVGVSVQDKTSTYNIYAKKVILATGGFANNKELIAQYAPDFVDSIPFCAGTNTGDGFKMAVDAGAGTVGNTMFGNIGVDGVIGIRPDYCMVYTFAEGKYMGVNIHGQRFGNESLLGYQRYADIVKQDTQTCWGIADSDNPDAAVLGSESDVAAGYGFVADSLEELAEMIGVAADALIETVDTYNSYCDAGEDPDFGVPADHLDRIDTAPYYAFLTRPIVLSSLVGVTVDEQCRVLTEDGQVIENLFAAGDMVLGNLLNIYTGARGVGNAMYTGDLAATAATQEILQAE